MKKITFLALLIFYKYSLIAQIDTCKINTVTTFLGSSNNKFQDASLHLHFGGNLDSLIRQTSLAHKTGVTITEKKDTVSIYQWGNISEPFWFYNDYNVYYELTNLPNGEFHIRIFHGYSNINKEKYISSMLLINIGEQAKLFYQDIVRKATQ